MNVLLNRLAEDHRRLTRLMNMMEGLLDQFHAGEEPNYALLCELMEYIVDFADQVHHPSEDLIFRRVIEQSGQDADLPHTLIHQHEVLSQLNRRFQTSVEGIVNEAVLRRDEVEEQGRELIRFQREHMRLEDEAGFPLALAALSDADWAALEAQAPQVEDPVFGHADRERFRTLYLQLKAEAAV